MACWICETRAPPGAAHVRTTALHSWIPARRKLLRVQESNCFDVACVHDGVRGATDRVCTSVRTHYA
eukprot:855989-Prymnesium_polylepis.1